MDTNFNDDTLRKIAAQLRKPDGEMGMETARRMNSGNVGMNSITLSKLNVKPGYKILEIGMANGYFVKDIIALSDGINYTGCDYSDLMVSEAVKLNKEFIDKGIVRFLCSSAEKMPFNDKEFDRIYAVNTIYFWDDLPSVTAELYRVLKPGGQAVIGYRPQRHIEKGPFTKWGFNAFSDEYIKNTFEEHRFKVISQDETPDEAVDGGRKFLTSVTVLVAER